MVERVENVVAVVGGVVNGVVVDGVGVVAG